MFKGMRGWDEDALEDAMEKFELTTKRKFGGDLEQQYSKFPAMCRPFSDEYCALTHWLSRDSSWWPSG
jgi:hypothetical protein